MYKITDQGVSTTSAEGFAVFIPEDANNSDWIIYLGWVADGNSPEPQFTEAELAAKQLQAAIETEAAWRSEEMKSIADQLLAIEDNDPARGPGTESEWREYRVKVRGWVSGAEGFPFIEHRPRRPDYPTN
ncbi:hypothetical protein [Pseudomonas fluorescens]|uniref:hypothetical protein n=1 Tax=Pseudomonas fluorescens TaxID=294 RepID=UPI003828F7C4